MTSHGDGHGPRRRPGSLLLRRRASHEIVTTAWGGHRAEAAACVDHEPPGARPQVREAGSVELPPPASSTRAVARSVSEACQDEFVPGSLPPADLSRSGGNEPDLCEHPLRGDVLVAGRRFERPQPIPLARNSAEVLQCGSRNPTTGDPLCKAETDHRGPIHEVVQIEATDDLPISIDEHVKNADPGFLLGQEFAMSLSELLIEIVATIADRLSEVVPVGLLKSEHPWFVIRA